MKVELLSPAGSFEKLKTAFYFGADAVYVGGKCFSLRAQASNFDNEELKMATEYTHSLGKKIYVAVNIFARNKDLDLVKEYVEFLQKIKVDGVICSDFGIIDIIKTYAPKLSIHISTQTNVTNYGIVNFWKNYGAERVVLARELSLKDITEIHNKVPNIELECFIHGAMCISYSGRCLLSEYFNHRDANQGDCVQACRWKYQIREVGRDGDFCDIEQDNLGTYILNSKDLNMIDYIGNLIDAGICSFKIEGRMKSEYYLATVVNAYRRAIDCYYKLGSSYSQDDTYKKELNKTAHRAFTTAYMLGENTQTVNHENSQSKGDSDFIAVVKSYDTNKKVALVEMRNRFIVGDSLEVLSPSESFNKIITVEKMWNKLGEEVLDAKLVQQELFLPTEIELHEGDILRKKANK